MIDERTFAPSNSLVFVHDLDVFEIPTWVRGESIVASRSCICISCLMHQDGETTFRFGPSDELDPGLTPTFEQIVETQSRRLVVTTVEGKHVFTPVPASMATRVKIWTNASTEPDLALIGFGQS